MLGDGCHDGAAIPFPFITICFYVLFYAKAYFILESPMNLLELEFSATGSQPFRYPLPPALRV